MSASCVPVNSLRFVRGIRCPWLLHLPFSTSMNKQLNKQMLVANQFIGSYSYCLPYQAEIILLKKTLYTLFCSCDESIRNKTINFGYLITRPVDGGSRVLTYQKPTTQ